MQRSLSFLACFFVYVHSSAQQYPFVYYTPKDGLVNSRVRSIKQDSKGRMYFITYGGLSVYDGARFTNYNQENGLANVVVNDVVEITPDSFLVASNTNQLNILVHGKAGVFKTADGFCPVVNKLFKSKDGYWYAAADDGLYVLIQKKFIKLNLAKNGKDFGQSIEKIVEWKDYFLILPWASKLDQKLLLYNKQTNRLEDVYTDHSVSGVCVDKNGLIWIAIAKGLYHPDIDKLQQGELNLYPASKQYPIVRQGNTGVFFDASGNGWLYRLNRIQTMSSPAVFLSAEQGLKATTLSDLFIDREGILWMASDGHGVIKLKNSNFQLLTSIVSNQQMTCSAIEVKEDTVWLFNMSTHSVYRITKQDTTILALKEKMAVLTIHASNGLIYLSNDRKVVVINQNHPAETFRTESIWFDSPTALGTSVIDANGVLIQFVQKAELDHYVYAIKNKKVLSSYKLDYLSDQMQIDHAGRLWIVTRNNRLLLFTLHPENPENYLQLQKDFSNEMGNINPRSIAIDKQNRVWIGTRFNGLYQFDLNDLQLKAAKHYTTKDGLTDNFVCRLAVDDQDNVWLGTQTGLDKLFMKDAKAVIANISKNNHVFQRILNIKTSGDGTIWATNQDGTVLKILPDDSSMARSAPSLFLTSVKTNNEDFDTALHRFSYHQNNLSVNIAAPSFFDEKSIRYSYLLEGSGNNVWSEPSNQTSFSFINLAAGEYKLLIRADFPEAMYAPQTISYEFAVLPPWWQTLWLRLITGLLLMAAILISVRFYYKRRMEKNKRLLEERQAIEKERTRIATDMHDDLGAGLSRIKFLSETIGIKKQQQKPIEEDIVKIREYSHQMIDKMGEIVWALNEKNDSLSDLLSYTRVYCMEYLSQNGIACEVDIPDDISNEFIRGEFRRNIFLSVKEVLHNIVKHAEANHVNINIETGKNLVLKIKDDGKGFDLHNIRPFSNGLSNIEKRMKDIGGSSAIKNGQGTMVKLTAPLSH